MRAWIWTLILLGVAVGAAVLVRDYTGNVVIVSPPYRIEVSLVFAGLALLALFIAVYVLLRLAGWSAGLVPRLRAWRTQRQLVREHRRLEQGWVRLMQGHYVKAREEFQSVVDVTGDANREVLAHLGLARSAFELNQNEAMTAALERARQSSQNDQGLSLAVACTAAELFLTQGKPEQAAVWIEWVKEGAARHVHLQRLDLQVNLALGHWEPALRQARSLARHHDARPEQESSLAQAAAGYLRSAADFNEAHAIWKRLKASERLLPDVALAAVVVLRDKPSQVREILQNALEANLDVRLLAAYAACEAAEVRPRLQRAESWLSRYPDHADLLRALGSLCLRGELWGPATGYLQRSLAQSDDARTHALLGTLFDHLGRSEEASRHWRLATALEVPVAAIQEGRGVLPSADTGADPQAVDSGLLEVDAPDDQPVRGVALTLPTDHADDIGAVDLPPRHLSDGAAVKVPMPSRPH